MFSTALSETKILCFWKVSLSFYYFQIYLKKVKLYKQTNKQKEKKKEKKGKTVK